MQPPSSPTKRLPGSQFKDTTSVLFVHGHNEEKLAEDRFKTEYQTKIAPVAMLTQTDNLRASKPQSVKVNNFNRFKNSRLNSQALVVTLKIWELDRSGLGFSQVNHT